ncbi:Shy1 protein [Martiniozyma asiatica (nom. inval.)]|nr:Shy1 protein [Martiniozyma asiatica]
MFLRCGLRRYATVKTANIDWNPLSSSQSLSKAQGPKTSRNVVFALLCLTPVVTFALGVWQVRRLKWKNNLIAECEDRLALKPLPLPKRVGPEDLANLEYRKVLVTGKFDYSREVYVGPRLHDGRKGFVVVCPFVQSNGEEVLIDRGWISEENVIPSSRNLQHLSCPQGVITVECVVRVPPTKSAFAAEHKGGRLYHAMDIDQMAKDLNSRAVYLQALQNYHDRWRDDESTELTKEVKKGWSLWKSKQDSAESNTSVGIVPKLYDTAEEFDPYQFISAGVPLGKIPKIDYKNNHLNYLVTWFSLSFCSSILLLYTLKKGKLMFNPGQEKMKHAKKIMG